MSETARKLIAKNLKKKEKSLDLGKCGLTDLNLIPELFECTHLEELILSDDWNQFDSEYDDYVRYRSRNTKKTNKIACFPPQFTRLTNLKKLRATRIGLENIDVLGDMPHLECLAIGASAFKEMNCLQNLKNLQGLDVSANYSLNRDFSVLESLTNLKFLDISAATVNNLDFLAQLANLRRLYIYSQFSEDISPLGNLKKLTFLQANRNRIADISAFKNLTRLESLFLGSNRIENIDSLENLQNLRFLILESNKIADISPLRNLIKLERLELTSNQINDLSPLQNLSVLNRLTLENNHIKTLEALKNMDYLSYLDFSRNQIEDISPLKDLQQLTNLYLYANKIKNIRVLENLRDLEALNLQSNELDDQAAQFVADVQNFPKLRYLYLSHNPFQNIPEDILKLNEVILLPNLRAYFARNI